MRQSGNIAVFAEFEFDPRRHELRRDGRQVALQEQPYQVLACLLERPDELVTREELRDRLWPAGSYVEYEKSINVAVMKLREALGDSAAEPRFIATLPRLGYRFIAPVEEAPEASLGVGPPGASPVDSEPTVHEQDRPTSEVEPAVSDSSEIRRSRRRLTIAGTLVLAALAVGYGAWRLGGGPEVQPIRSLAVLPFVDQSPQAGEEYLASGLTEELITSLAQIGGLSVTSRTSSEAMGASEASLPEQARRLGVDAVVEGSVLRAGTRVRVIAQLIHAPTDRHLWAGRYEREENDILGFQNEIARDIAREIAVSLAPREERRLERRPTNNPEAYREYLKAGYHKNRRSVEGYVKAVRHFRRAIEMAPDFAQAHAALGLTYFEMGVLGILVSDEAHARALEEAEQALRLDPELPSGHAVRGFVLVHGEQRWSEAEAAFRRARELGASTDLVHRWVAMAAQGRHREARAEVDRMLQLDPLNPVASEAVAYVHYLAREYDAAIAQYEYTLELDGARQGALQGLGNAHAAAGRPEAALEAYVLWMEAAGFGPQDAADLRGSFAGEGLPGLWRYLLGLEELDEEETDQVWPYRRATLHARLGEVDEAFHWLDAAFAEQTTNLVYLGSEPIFDGLRDDPRFSASLRRLNLDPRAFLRPSPQAAS